MSTLSIWTKCPSWHFLAGPYQDDEDRTNCPDRESHEEQRVSYLAQIQAHKEQHD